MRIPMKLLLTKHTTPVLRDCMLRLLYQRHDHQIQLEMWDVGVHKYNFPSYNQNFTFNLLLSLH
jgi:hypothetical protein